MIVFRGVQCFMISVAWEPDDVLALIPSFCARDYLWFPSADLFPPCIWITAPKDSYYCHDFDGLCAWTHPKIFKANSLNA